ncbi:MAG: phospholipase D family protein [Xanthomonadales bacterium]
MKTKQRRADAALAANPRPPGLSTLRRLATLAFCALLSACVSLPENYPREESVTLDGPETRVARTVWNDLETRPGQSAAYPLAEGMEALAARVNLARAAERSLDVQYYIWHADEAGRILLKELLDAADRGVRVRVLLDDLGVGAADDSAFLLFEAHPRVSIRLFNPIALRNARTLGLVTDPIRMNQRMHNKSMTADNRATIVGGRNIGNEYFSLDELVNFADLDVLAAGPVVSQVSESFDAFWNSPASFPLSAFHDTPRGADELAAARKDLDAWLAANAARYYDAMRDTPIGIDLSPRELFFYHGRITTLSDRPEKVLGENPERLVDQLGNLLGRIDEDLLIISPYFVPGKEGVRALNAAAARGAQVRVYTNSLAATDVAAVHAGYRKSRRDLLAGGVELYEMMPRLAADEAGERSLAFSGSSGASLHAKMFIIDRRRVFIGSLNLDPRSIDLNTEIGLLIESPELAAHLAAGIERTQDNAFYSVRLEPDNPGEPGGSGKLIWVEHRDGATIEYDKEPQTTAWQRFMVRFISLFPIDSQL